MTDVLIPVALILGSAAIISVFISQVFSTGRADRHGMRSDEDRTLLRRLVEQQAQTTAEVAALAARMEGDGTRSTPDATP